MIDLYPEDSWNFVFGQASLAEGEWLQQGYNEENIAF